MKRLKKLAVCLMTILMVAGGAFQSSRIALAAGSGAAAAGSGSDTVHWFNATYAILTYLNGGDYTIPGGGAPGSFYAQCMKLVMERDWGVTDRASAQEKIKWLETEGHNQGLLQNYAKYNMDQYATNLDQIAALNRQNISRQEKVRQMAAYEAVQLYGDNAVAAWDLSRAMMLLGDYYVAGYYTYEEAMDKSLEIAKKLQGMYSSWDDFAQSYMYGYAYWSKSDPEDPNSQYQRRTAVYFYLKGLENSPYQVDWNLPLNKEW